MGTTKTKLGNKAAHTTSRKTIIEKMITANSGSFSRNWGLFGLGVASKHNTVSPRLRLVFHASATSTNALYEFRNKIIIALLNRYLDLVDRIYVVDGCIFCACT